MVSEPAHAAPWSCIRHLFCILNLLLAPYPRLPCYPESELAGFKWYLTHNLWAHPPPKDPRSTYKTSQCSTCSRAQCRLLVRLKLTVQYYAAHATRQAGPSPCRPSRQPCASAASTSLRNPATFWTAQHEASPAWAWAAQKPVMQAKATSAPAPCSPARPPGPWAHARRRPPASAAPGGRRGRAGGGRPPQRSGQLPGKGEPASNIHRIIYEMMSDEKHETIEAGANDTLRHL